MDEEPLAYKPSDDYHTETKFFSTSDEIQERKGKYSKGRFGYLQALVTEFMETDEADAKEQVLANLANFAYDPVNYDNFRKLQVIDLFLDMLEEDDAKLREFGAGGLCNLCIDPKNASVIIQNNGIPMLMRCLSSPNEETVVSAISTLFYLLSSKTKKDIATPAVLDCMIRYSKSSNPRLKNVAAVFIQESNKLS